MLGWLISQNVFIDNVKGINIDIDFIGIKRISKNNYIFLFWIKNYNDQGHLYFNNSTRASSVSRTGSIWYFSDMS